MPILIEQGLENGPFLPYPNKLRYMWRDLERRAFRYGIPYQKPSVYPPNTLLTARIGYLAQTRNWCARFTQEIFRLHWTGGAIIGTDENIRRSLDLIGQHADSIISAAQSDDNKKGLRLQTEQAKARGIFGSPTFVVGDELFWGDDRLEDALDHLSTANP
jgi:2-hydroxychromene-2-carboxylate isomerase